MNLRQMEYMLTIVETKNISRAAERCYISQSGMSQQLASVERELGVTLFKRVNNELVPTQEGDIYLRYAKEILGLHARALREMEDCANPNKGKIIIGVSPERGNAMIQQVFPVFRRSFPQMQIQIVENHLEELEQMVCNNLVNISEASYTPEIATSISEQVKKIDLYSERIMLIMPRTPYFERKLERLGASEEGSVVDLREFKEENFVLPTQVRVRLRSLVDRLFEEAGFVPRVALETSNNASAINYVADGDYVSLVPQSYCYSILGKTERIFYRVVTQNPYWIRAMIYRKEAKLTEAEKELVRVIKEYHRPVMEQLKQDNQGEPRVPQM